MPLLIVPRRDRKLNREVKAAELVPLRRGEGLWKPGDPATALVLVREGHLRLVEGGRSARTARTVGVVGPWELTGEEALLSASPRRYRAVAGEVATVQWLDAGKVDSALATSRVTREAFVAASLDDLAALAHRATGSAHPDAAGRLASVLLHLARRFSHGTGAGEGKEPRAGTIPLQLTHRTLADLAGLHRSTVTTLLNDWFYQRWIADARPGIRIADAGVFRGMAGLAG